MAFDIRPDANLPWYAPDKDIRHLFPKILAKALEMMGAEDNFQATVAQAANAATAGLNGSVQLLKSVPGDKLRLLGFYIMLVLFDKYEESIDAAVRDQARNALRQLEK